MELDIHQPVGVSVTGVSLRHLEPEQVVEITAVLAEHGVAVFPAQDIEDDDLVALLEQLGDIVFTTGETPVDGFPDLNIITNVGRTTPPKSNFHVDSSYLRRPPDYTALRAVNIPSEGGQTLFTNQYRAFETLPEDVVEGLTGRSINHVVTGLELGEDDETSAEHPVLQPHPLSGRTALYLSTPARCAAVTGMGQAEAAEMVSYLYEHSTAAANTYRHEWSTGDVVIWDNRCVMHRADHSGVVGDRVMHRGMAVSRA